MKTHIQTAVRRPFSSGCTERIFFHEKADFSCRRFCGTHEKITAPFAGTLLAFDLRQGDSVAANETLFTMDTTPIYATQAGTVSAVFAGVGDDASGVAAHYGSLAVIEPKNALYIAASTQQAYDDADNRYIHAGETLYLKRNSDKGTGIVTSVSGSGYIVEILTGDYDVNDTIRCFRESSMPSDSEVGRGKVTRYDDVLVNASSGRIAAVHVKAGDKVEVGDLLFEVIDAQSTRGASLTIPSPVDGAGSQQRPRRRYADLYAGCLRR